MYQKLNFLFDIYEMGRYTLENWEILKTYFQNGEFSTQTVRIISRNADVNWPPCSCDLTPLDYFLWGTEFYGEEELEAISLLATTLHFAARQAFPRLACRNHKMVIGTIFQHKYSTKNRDVSAANKMWFFTLSTTRYGSSHFQPQNCVSILRHYSRRS